MWDVVYIFFFKKKNGSFFILLCLLDLGWGMRKDGNVSVDDRVCVLRGRFYVWDIESPFSFIWSFSISPPFSAGEQVLISSSFIEYYVDWIKIVGFLAFLLPFFFSSFLLFLTLPCKTFKNVFIHRGWLFSNFLFLPKGESFPKKEKFFFCSNKSGVK